MRNVAPFGISTDRLSVPFELLQVQLGPAKEAHAKKVREELILKTLADFNALVRPSKEEELAAVSLNLFRV